MTGQLRAVQSGAGAELFSEQENKPYSYLCSSSVHRNCIAQACTDHQHADTRAHMQPSTNIPSMFPGSSAQPCPPCSKTCSQSQPSTSQLRRLSVVPPRSGSAGLIAFTGTNAARRFAEGVVLNSGQPIEKVRRLARRVPFLRIHWLATIK
jgi:hypothetical protein